jgi:hypothetical protein
VTSTVLLACPAHDGGGEWFWRWKELIEEWQGGWDTSGLKPGHLPSWRRRALEQGGNRWVILADPGCAPGVVALFQALQVLALRPRVCCVCLVPPEWIGSLPEVSPADSSLWSAPFASGGVVILKGSAVARSGYPEPRFYPSDLAEMTFKMTRNGLEVLLLPDPSFLGPPQVSSFQERLRLAWSEGKGSAAFRLAHKGQAPKSLRLPDKAFALLLMSPWLVGSMAWRYARGADGSNRGPTVRSAPPPQSAKTKRSDSVLKTSLRAFCAIPESVAFLAGAFQAYLQR